MTKRIKLLLMAGLLLFSQIGLSFGVFTRPASAQSLPGPEQFGSPTLLDGQFFSPEGWAGSPHLADVNNDGYEDAITFDVRLFNGNINVRLGNGDGTFGPRIATPVTGLRGSILVDDFTGDGIADAIYVQESIPHPGDTTSAVFEVRPTNLDGTFASIPTQSITVPAGGRDFRVHDINGDGHKDIIGLFTSNGTEDGLYIFTFFNDGNGQFTLLHYPQEMAGIKAVDDITGDGHADIFGHIQGSSVVGAVWAGDGTGQFNRIGDNILGIHGPDWTNAVVADFTNDEKPDIAVFNHGTFVNDSQAIRVYRNLGGGIFQPDFPPNNVNTIFSTRVSRGFGLLADDVDNDGNKDLINWSNTDMTVYLGDGTGQMTGVHNFEFPSGGRFSSPVTGDVNNNGYLELLFGAFGTTPRPLVLLNLNVPSDSVAPYFTTQPSWSSNPLPVGNTTSFSIAAADDESGVEGGEYYVGTDTGVGSGTPISWDGVILDSGSFGANLPTGYYEVGIRVKDVAGNWSDTLTTWLVVFDPAGPGRVTGMNQVTPIEGVDELPWFATGQSASFSFNVEYTETGQVDPNNSNFNFDYIELGSCKSPNTAPCRTFSLNATSFEWLSIGGVNNSQGVFQGSASLDINGTVSNIDYRVTAVDGKELEPSEADSFRVDIYPEGSPKVPGNILYHVSGNFEPGQNGNASGGIDVKK